jgi:hypothetical protein
MANAIVFDASIFNASKLAFNAAQLLCDEPISEFNATFNGDALPTPLIVQSLTLTGNMTQPSARVAAAAYFPIQPNCITARADGFCQTEPPISIGDALASRSNAFVGSLMYTRR